jgi:(p)ppGpp synthase/HD superfamily hydrolase
MDGFETLKAMGRTDFVDRSPLTQAALEFAASRHEGQTREREGIPFVTHPVEVACLLHEAGYSDEVVAAGVLHDVLEDTNAQRDDLERRFGAEVTRLVVAVSDDPSIDEYAPRKAALRDKVAQAGECAAAVFAADKISKARELGDRRGRFSRHEKARIEHYEASLQMLERTLPGRGLVDLLRAELEALHAVS